MPRRQTRRPTSKRATSSFWSGRFAATADATTVQSSHGHDSPSWLFFVLELVFDHAFAISAHGFSVAFLEYHPPVSLLCMDYAKRIPRFRVGDGRASG